MTHTPFVSNPCPATAIVFVSQNLFYGQLPQPAAFLWRLPPAEAGEQGRGALWFFLPRFHMGQRIGLCRNPQGVVVNVCINFRGIQVVVT